MKWFFPVMLLTTPLLAETEKKPPVGVEVVLISDHASITRGGTFQVGFQIRHQPGYHTYWQNPGIAGVATALVWQLPEGFTVGPIRWPYPEKTKMASYSIYGYERDAMLVVEITAPAELTGPSAILKLDATWMACDKGCSPGREKLEITLPVADQAVMDTTTASIFAKALEQIPGPLETWSVDLLTAKDAKEPRLRLRPHAKATPTPSELYFFSADGQISSEHPQPVTFHPDGGYEIALTRAEYSPTGKPSLPGVLKMTIGQAPVFVAIDPIYPTAGK